MNPISKVNRTHLSNPLLSGLLYSFIWLFAAILVVSVILTFTGFREQSLGVLTYVIHGISVCMGGFVAGKRSGSKGWYQGGLMGVIYTLLVLLISFLGFDAALGTHFAILLVISGLSGALGGILGVNAKQP